MTLDDVRFDINGLVPVVVRDVFAGRVAMLGWANRDAIERTIATGEATLWSRSRQALWVKGETSGNGMQVLSVLVDCDGDALLYEARLAGPACHSGSASCFHRLLAGFASPAARNFALDSLFELLECRYRERPEDSYSTELFDSGLDRILKKVGEEASEVIIAMKNSDVTALAHEIADLLYHLAVAMTARGITTTEVNDALLRSKRTRHDSRSPPQSWVR